MAQTTADLAAAFNTTPRTLRKFLRAEDKGVGKGSRYSLPTAKREVAAMNKRFTAWQEAIAAKKVEAKDIDIADCPETDEEMEMIIDGTHPDFA